MIMNTMELDGYTAVITYDADKDWFRGVIQGLNGSKQASGKFVVRLPPELHRQAATVATASGISMNALIERAIKHELAQG